MIVWETPLIVASGIVAGLWLGALIGWFMESR